MEAHKPKENFFVTQKRHSVKTEFDDLNDSDMEILEELEEMVKQRENSKLSKVPKVTNASFYNVNKIFKINDFKVPEHAMNSAIFKKKLELDSSLVGEFKKEIKSYLKLKKNSSSKRINELLLLFKGERKEKMNSSTGDIRQGVEENILLHDQTNYTFLDDYSILDNSKFNYQKIPATLSLQFSLSDISGNNLKITKNVDKQPIKDHIAKKFRNCLGNESVDYSRQIENLQEQYQNILEEIKGKAYKLTLPVSLKHKFENFNEFYEKRSDAEIEEYLRYEESKILSDVIKAEETRAEAERLKALQMEAEERRKQEEEEQAHKSEIQKRNMVRLAKIRKEYVPSLKEIQTLDDNEMVKKAKKSQNASENSEKSSSSLEDSENMDTVQDIDKIKIVEKTRTILHGDHLSKLKVQDSHESVMSNRDNMMDIIDKLLAADSIFDVDLSFLKKKERKIKFPDNLKFDTDEEKTLFEKVYEWMLELEDSIAEDERVIEQSNKAIEKIIMEQIGVEEDDDSEEDFSGSNSESESSN